MTWARAAGAGYLVIIVAGIYAEFFVRSSLIAPGDPALTAANVAASELLFRSGIAADLVMLVADVLVAAALYIVFREFNRGVALLAAFFRLAHAAVYGATLLSLYLPLLLVGDAGYLAALGADRLNALVLLLLEAHGYGYVIALVFFGVYCLLLGWLVIRSGWVPRILGYLLILAAAGYLADSFAQSLLPDYDAYAPVLQWVVFGPAFVGELSFALWLAAKGVRPQRPGEPA